MRKRTLDIAKRLMAELELEASQGPIEASNLIGVSDWAKLEGVPSGTIQSYIRRGYMPEPIAVINRNGNNFTRVYTRQQYEAWKKTRSHPRTPGKTLQSLQEAS